MPRISLKKRLTVQVALSSLLLALILGLALGWTGTRMARQETLEGNAEVTHTVAESLPRSTLDSLLDGQSTDESPAYTTIRGYLENAKHASLHGANFYVLTKTDSGWIYLVDGYEGDDHSPLGTAFSCEDTITCSLLESAWKNSIAIDNRFVRDEWGVWLSSYAHVDGMRVPTVIGIDIPADQIEKNEWITLGLAVGASLLGALLVALATWRGISRALSRELGTARRAVECLEAGDLHDPVIPDTKDELAEMSQALYNTVQHLRLVFGSAKVEWTAIQKSLTNATRLATLLEEMPQPLLEASADWNSISGNKALLKLFPSPHKLREALQAQATDGKEREFVVESRVWKSQLHHMKSTGPSSHAFLVLFHDITADKEMEASRTAIAQAEQKRLAQEAAAREAERLRLQNEAHKAETLRQQVESVLQVMQANQEGDLGRRTGLQGNGLVEQLAIALDAFLADQSERLQSLVEHSCALAEHSESLSELSGNLQNDAGSAADQAAHSREAASEVHQQLQRISQELSHLENGISDVAKHSRQVTQAAGNAVATSSQAAKRVQELEDASRAIGDVSRLVSDISRQTNLLALNAAVEAARAGDAGLGFAVVAGEVKSLAERTRQATADIDQRLIGVLSITRHVSEIVSGIQAAISDISSQQKNVDNTLADQSTSTKAIGEGVQTAVQKVAEVHHDLGLSAQVAQTSSQGASQLQERAEELSGMATAMQELLGRFRF